MVKVLVLGGRGFVGRAVCKALGKHTVYTFDRHKGSRRHIQGDVLNEKDLIKAIKGKQVVVNLVGLTPMRTPAKGMYQKIHVDAVEKIVHVCKKLKIKRLIHMSVLGADAKAKTKFLKTRGMGQLLVEHSGLKYTIFRPSLIFDKENELVQQAIVLARGKMFPKIPALIQPVYRGDVARLFKLAVDGKMKQVMDVGGPERMSVFEFVSKIYNQLGHTCIGVPLFLVRFGMQVFAEFGWLGISQDQVNSLELENITSSIAGKKHFSDWVKVL